MAPNKRPDSRSAPGNETTQLAESLALREVAHVRRLLRSRRSPVEACHLRFRSILMTTMRARLAGVPLITGIGSEIRQPLGYAIVGGLVSQLMTLFTTPVVCIYLDCFGHWLGRRRAAGAAARIIVREVDAS